MVELLDGLLGYIDLVANNSIAMNEVIFSTLLKVATL